MTPRGDRAAEDVQLYGEDVVIRRSTRRKKTLSARREGDVIIVMVPANLPLAVEKQQVGELIARVRAKTESNNDAAALHDRARYLAEHVLEGRPRFTEITWVTNMEHRWASVTRHANGEARIRVSHRLREVPSYVLDNVLVHELAHTFVAGGHTPEFWRWAQKAPQHERAQGYLEAYQRWGKRD